MKSAQDQMAALAARFASRAQAERDALHHALETGDRAALTAQAHKLAGIAGMFGHPQIGAAALELESAAESGADYVPAANRLDELLAKIAD